MKNEEAKAWHACILKVEEGEEEGGRRERELEHKYQLTNKSFILSTFIFPLS